MKKVGWVLVITLCIAFFTSCSGVKDKKVTDENKGKIWEEIKNSKDLTVEEVQLLQAYLIRNGMKAALSGKEVTFPVGKTIGEAIEEQRKFVEDAGVREREEKDKKEKAKAAEEQQRKELLDALTVTVYDKGFQKVDYQDYIALKFSYENRSSKDIRGFKGTMVFNDLFGDKINEAELKEDAILKAGETRRVTKTLSYNQFMEKDRKLQQTTLENMHVEWLPDIIMFTDGSSLKVSN